jgi:short-subunit dehydrogenase
MPAALITGASTGIGREFAYLCAHAGYDVVLTARSEARLEELAGDVRQRTGRKAFSISIDLANPASPSQLYRQVAELDVAVEVLINNAGFGLVGRFWELDESEQMQMIQLNIGALTHLTRLLLPDFIARRRGYILNVASTAAFQPGPLMSVYYASKAYVVSFSEALHNEAHDHGVKVTCLCPGPTKTEFDKRSGASGTKLFKDGNAMSALSVAQIGWNALQANKSLVVAGELNALMAFLTRFAPRQLAASIARRMQEPK